MWFGRTQTNAATSRKYGQRACVRTPTSLCGGEEGRGRRLALECGGHAAALDSACRAAPESALALEISRLISLASSAGGLTGAWPFRKILRHGPVGLSGLLPFRLMRWFVFQSD